MKLRDLINGVKIKEQRGDIEIPISGVSYDSRAVSPGYLFVALRGNNTDGHNFIRDSIQNGASAVVGEQLSQVPNGIPFIKVEDSREALAVIASNFFNRPYRDLEVVGITGTNGKTTTTYLLESILISSGEKPGIIGTVEYRFSGKTYPAPITTPESFELMRMLRKMSDSGVKYVIMEVSSHAIAQKRIWSCPFRVGVFTNLSRDHLDYHGRMEEYFQTKALLFEQLNRRFEDYTGSRWAVINLDDPWGRRITDITQVPTILYGTGKGAHVRARDVIADLNGIRGTLEMPDGSADFKSHLIGKMNIYNILAASATAHCLGFKIDDIVTGIERLKRVPGRMDVIETDIGFHVIVDYAHTPDALLKVLQSLQGITKGRLLTIFGCGGDRDKGKRYEMGEVSAKFSHVVIITSDNPRSEDPISIISAIEKGVRAQGLERVEWNGIQDLIRGYYLVEPDRRVAIQKAVRMAKNGDIVLIAGKGHETYQIIGDTKIPFDDREEASIAISSIRSIKKE